LPSGLARLRGQPTSLTTQPLSCFQLNGCCSYSTTTRDSLRDKVLGPMPGTFCNASALVKGPCSSRYATMACALEGPTPFTATVDSAAPAVLMVDIVPVAAKAGSLDTAAWPVAKPNANHKAGKKLFFIFIVLLLLLLIIPRDDTTLEHPMPPQIEALPSNTRCHHSYFMQA